MAAIRDRLEAAFRVRDDICREYGVSRKRLTDCLRGTDLFRRKLLRVRREMAGGKHRSPATQGLADGR